MPGLPHSDDEDTSPLLPTNTSKPTATPKPSFVEVKWRCGPLCTSFIQLPVIGVVLLLASIGILTYITRSGRHHSSSNHWPSNIGYEGPTPTGSEAFAAATSYPSYHDISPLKPPSNLYPAQDPEGGKVRKPHGSNLKWGLECSFLSLLLVVQHFALSWKPFALEDSQSRTRKLSSDS